MWLIFGLYVWMAQRHTKLIRLFAHNANAKDIAVTRVLGSMASSPVAIAKCDSRTLPEAAACWVRCRTFCVAGEDLSYREALWTQAALNATPARALPGDQSSMHSTPHMPVRISLNGLLRPFRPFPLKTRNRQYQPSTDAVGHARECVRVSVICPT
jgi:hypothetical protein